MKNWINEIKPDVCLSDTYIEDDVHEDAKSLFQELKNRGIQIGYYPDATNLMFSPDLLPALTMSPQYFDRLKRKVDFELSDYDFFLTDTKYRTDFIKEIVDRRVVFHVGPPDLDTVWLDHLIQKAKKGTIALSNETDINRVLVLLQKEYAVNVHDNDFRSLFREILSVCLNDPKAHVTLKPHPNLNQQLLYDLLSEYPRDRVSISEVASIVLIEASDIVISMPTSVILTAVLMGRPVIEYFNYGKANKVLIGDSHQLQNKILGTESIDDKGNITSIYRKLLIVQGANNPDELQTLLNGDNQAATKTGMDSLRLLYPDGACRKTVEAIWTVMDQI